MKGFGKLLRPRQEAAKPFSAAFRGGRAADPSFVPWRNRTQWVEELALCYLAFVITRVGGSGGMLTNLAHVIGRSVAQIVATAATREVARNSARPQLGCQRGSVDTICGEPIKLNRGRLAQCVRGQ